jgi:hypothetical protein
VIPFLALALAGFYSQDCANGFRRAQHFQSGTVVYREENFFDSECRSPSVATRSYGAFTLGSPVLEPIGARELDFRFEKVTLEPKTEAVAGIYRDRALCGLEEWSVGKETEITGLECDFLDNGAAFAVPTAGEMRFGIVGIGEDRLLFGRLSPAFPGRSPLTRPRQFDPRPYLRKAN